MSYLFHDLLYYLSDWLFVKKREENEPFNECQRCLNVIDLYYIHKLTWNYTHYILSLIHQIEVNSSNTAQS